MLKKVFNGALNSWKYILATIFGLFVLFLLVDFIFPFRFQPRYSQIILSKEGKPLHFFLSEDDKWRIKSTLAELPEELKKSILYKEDKYFYYHFGINLFSIAQAFTNNIIQGKKVSGASTITMQVARLLEPKPRTYKNKVIETFRAFQLEWHLSKDEILSLYFNLVPYGGNIEGVRAASLLYFGIEPSELSLAQTVVLAIVPNRPTSLALGKYNTAIRIARNQWLAKLKQNALFSDDEIEEALIEPLEAYRRNSPKKAPHFAYQAKRNHSNIPVLSTTLHYETQAIVHELSAQYLQRTKAFGVYNAAVLVVDNAKKEIIAYVGNPDFNDNLNAGQVDGTRALRSPGSTLKPFIYGLTFDAGIYTPLSILYDVPVDFENYSPQNFDLHFNGKVTVKTALESSLNVVAVNALEEIGVPKLIQTLEMAGFASISRYKHSLGLSLALGGCGVSLFEMAGIYSALATKGKFGTLTYLQKSTETSFPQRQQIMSPDAAFMVTDILSEIDRPDLPNQYLSTSKVPKIAWKTGTSYGRRDAWSIGYNKKYTVAVWMGNFNGKGARALTGAGIATPLLFKIFNTIDYNSNDNWYEAPESLRERVVCQETGLLPSENCTAFATDYFIPRVSSIKQCNHQKTVFISADESESYCIHCLPSSGYKKKLFPNYKPEMITYYKQVGFPTIKPPPHYKGCKEVAVNNEESFPEIISPLDGREYIVEEDTELMLQCHTANDVTEVYWYINNQFLAKTKSTEKVFFVPPKGQVKISCSDNRGRNTDSFIVVK